MFSNSIPAGALAWYRGGATHVSLFADGNPPVKGPYLRFVVVAYLSS